MKAPPAPIFYAAFAYALRQRHYAYTPAKFDGYKGACGRCQIVIDPDHLERFIGGTVLAELAGESAEQFSGV